VDGGDAKSQLSKFDKDRLSLLGEIEILSFAIGEANSRVAEAERAQEAAVETARCVTAISIAADIEKIGKDLDRHLSGLGDGWDALKSAFDRLHQTGMTHPSHSQRTAYGEHRSADGEPAAALVAVTNVGVWISHSFQSKKGSCASA